MKKATMIRHYRNHSAAEEYIIGFEYKKMLYFVKVAEILPRWLNVEKASRNQGQNLRMRIRKAEKLALINKGAICLGLAAQLKQAKYNKGEIFEKIITEYYGQQWVKDTVPFWVQGDIKVNNVEIQIKLDAATLMNTKQIEKNFYKINRKAA